MNLPILNYEQIFQLSSPYEEKLRGIIERASANWSDKTLFTIVSIAFSMGRIVERKGESNEG